MQSSTKRDEREFDGLQSGTGHNQRNGNEKTGLWMRGIYWTGPSTVVTYMACSRLFKDTETELEILTMQYCVC